MIVTIFLCIASLWICNMAASDTNLEQNEVNQLVSPDLFGELVDIMTPGYLHWSSADGDTVDPYSDKRDIDNNFGEHHEAVGSPEFSNKTERYGQGNVAEEFAHVYRDKAIQWKFAIPGAGQYIIATRLWRELQERTDAVFSYNSDGEWIDLPVVEDIQHWGGYGNLVCFLIKVPEGTKSIPVRVRATSGRCLIYRILLGKRRDKSPFTIPVEHPSMYFRMSDLSMLRKKVSDGPPKFAYDYMIQQVGWYTNTLNRGERSWKQPQSSAHHVSRSLAQTAFVSAITEKDEYLGIVLRMADAVMSWPRNENPIVDQQGKLSVLVRARQLSAMAMLYDWLYHKLPENKRLEWRDFLDREANRLYLYNETGVGCTQSHNWDPWIAAGYGMVGVAFREEHTWSQNWIDSAKRILDLNLRTSHEDFGYFNNGFTKALDFAASLYTSTGEDLFTPNASRLKALMDFRMILLEPSGKGYPGLGDANAGNDPLLALSCATFLKDSMSQWYLNNLSCGSIEQVKNWGWNHMMPVAVVTLYDPEIEVQPPGEPRLSLAKSFANEMNLPSTLQAVTIMRTGYNRTDDIQLGFRCGDYSGWHGHPDQGSFILNAYGERFIVDKALGAPYGTPANNFSKSSLAHSIVLIDGEGQVQYSAPVFHDREAGHTSPLLHTNFIDYIVADSTTAYLKNPNIGTMDHAYRHFFFVRKPDHHAYVIVFDDLQVDGKSHKYDWLLQTNMKNDIISEDLHHKITVGNAELHVLTIEPEQISMSKSQEYDIWQSLRLSDPAPKQRGIFLNILYPKLKQTPLSEVERLAGKGFVGASINSGDIFLFATGSGGIKENNISTDGQIAALNRWNDQIQWFLCVDGTSMEIDGRELFRSDEKITIALDNSRNGRILVDNAAADQVNIIVTFGDTEPTVLTISSQISLIKNGQLVEQNGQ